jgi:hypothetical protein
MNKSIRIFITWSASKPNILDDEVRDATIAILEFAPQLKFEKISVTSVPPIKPDLPELFATDLDVTCSDSSAIVRQQFEDAYRETAQHSTHPVNTLGLRSHGVSIRALEIDP